ncbi:MAG: DUF3300 domain-containing protein [Methyloceanibacter sp.]|uniref:DUF3300 domain-containing protein n=1 Tax=Methyloceanibacter sp. TaxID=1965321 RepID=UPI001DAB22C3|nr:DUF3300 domain-containing protein [Methyloceanibacter sp.]MCB1442956.1 DUF3300 domain-containing protein [Methyloceanibacter sp.]
MRLFMIPVALVFALCVQGAAFAEDTQSGATAGEAEPATDASAADTSPETAQDENLLSEAELEQLVAPIALYPDPLLANVMIASTYPLEIVQADRWYQKNKELKGDALQEALADQNWDDSIKDLVAVPDALEMMNKDLDWTQKLGDAVLAQQSDVMDAVQALRARAKENGKLESNPQQTVTVTQTVIQNGNGASDGGQATSQGAPQTRDVIAIQPTNPETVYVPYYEPSVVYGSWPYPNYEPYYFPPPPGYAFGSALATGLVWSAGFAIGNAIWGDDLNWGRNDINVNVNRNISGNTINRNNVNAQKWEHNAEHRRGVQYNNADVRNKFSNTQIDRNNVGNKVGNNVGNKVGDLGDKRPGGGNLGDRRPGNGGQNRPTVGDIEAGLERPGGGNLADKRPGGGNGRPGGGNAGGKLPGNAGGKRPSVGDIEAGLKKPGGGNLADKRPGNGNGPGAGGGNRPNVGGAKRPNAGDLQANLKNKAGPNKPSVNKPSINKPDVKKPSVNKPAAKKPSVSKPAASKPKSQPSGNAFKKESGSAARKASARGHASAGHRDISRGRGGGGGRAAGGRRR